MNLPTHLSCRTWPEGARLFGRLLTALDAAEHGGQGPSLSRGWVSVGPDGGHARFSSFQRPQGWSGHRCADALAAIRDAQANTEALRAGAAALPCLTLQGRTLTFDLDCVHPGGTGPAFVQGMLRFEDAFPPRIDKSWNRSVWRGVAARNRVAETLRAIDTLTGMEVEAESPLWRVVLRTTASSGTGLPAIAPIRAPSARDALTIAGLFHPVLAGMPNALLALHV